MFVWLLQEAQVQQRRAGYRNAVCGLTAAILSIYFFLLSALLRRFDKAALHSITKSKTKRKKLGICKVSVAL